MEVTGRTRSAFHDILKPSNWALRRSGITLGDFQRGERIVTVAEFRSLALSLPEAVESGHMDHPDFRVRGKIFATLGYPDEAWGMVKLTPEQQGQFIRAEPGVFVPAAGAWGQHGSTTVRLASVSDGSVRHAIAAAWRNVAPKGLAQKHEIDE